MDIPKALFPKSAFTKKTLLIIAILLVGSYARFAELGWHFTNVDDAGVAQAILQSKEKNEHDLFAVQRVFNYAPLQFIFTHFLISPDQTYRDFLFWGRLPSCVIGILGLLAMVLFYHRLYGLQNAKVFLPLALLAFSWENIAHAKQMHHYAAGVSAAIALLALLALNLKQKDYSLKRILLNSAVLALLSHAQYQIPIFIPAFFLTLFCHSLLTERKKIALLGKWALGGFVYLALVAPMWFFFLRARMMQFAGAPEWARGANYEFVLTFKEGASLWAKIVTAVLFFTKNLFLIFQSKIAFLPESSFLFPVLVYFFYGLFALGAISFLDTKDERKKFLGMFFGILAITWAAMVALHKLHFAPTRHSLILLPVLAVTISEGIGYCFEKLKQFHDHPWARWVETKSAPALTVAALLLFCLYYGTFLKERRDPFVESEILEVLEKYQVDSLLVNTNTDNLMLMKSIRRYQDEVASKSENPYKCVAWLSRRDVPYTTEQCETMRQFYNLQLLAKAAQEKTPPVLIPPCSDYRLVYSKQIDSDVQVDFSKFIKKNLYTNSFHFYVFKIDR